MAQASPDSNIIDLLRAKWQKDAIKNAQNKIMPIHANVMLALRSDPDVRDVFAYDQMARTTVMTHEIGSIETANNRLAVEADVHNFLEWLQHHGLPNVKIDVVRGAINTRASEAAFHPVLEYLSSLQWDGVPRLSSWLTTYLGAELTKYNENIGRMFLLSLVARVVNPGCQADYMMVLEGSQGVEKSKACRALAGRWFSDHLPDITASGGREASQHLRGKWLIEVAEMHAMDRADSLLLKSFISRPIERYRPWHGRLEVIEPRQCVFVGTTNEDNYLKDPTGGRRFWPVKTCVTGRIEIDLLEEMRDQLFAEAVEAYGEGGMWWPDRQLEGELIKPEQAARYAGDIWEEKIGNYVKVRDRVTVAEIASECLTIVTGQQTRAHEARISAILKEIGWSPKRTKSSRFWVRD